MQHKAMANRQMSLSRRAPHCVNSHTNQTHLSRGSDGIISIITLPSLCGHIPTQQMTSASYAQKAILGAVDRDNRIYTSTVGRRKKTLQEIINKLCECAKNASIRSVHTQKWRRRSACPSLHFGL